MKLPSLEEVKERAPGYIAVACIFLLAGAGIGWALKPDVVKIEERVKTVEVEKQVVVVQEKVKVEVVKVKDTQVVERYRRERNQSADGAFREVEERNIDSVITEKVTKTEVKVVEVEKQVVVEKEVQKLVKVDPVVKDWHVGVMGGTELLAPVPVFGAEVERRIAGPFWLGIWGNANTHLSRGQVGLKVAVEF